MKTDVLLTSYQSINMSKTWKFMNCRDAPTRQNDKIRKCIFLTRSYKIVKTPNIWKRMFSTYIQNIKFSQVVRLQVYRLEGFVYWLRYIYIVSMMLTCTDKHHPHNKFALGQKWFQMKHFYVRVNPGPHWSTLKRTRLTIMELQVTM